MSQNHHDLTGDSEPIYNIGVVSRMTDIAETTLRAWERRYQFPEALRTPGGHRLYSPQTVIQLQWVKSRVDAGMQVSQAIRALRRLLDDGGDVSAPLPAEAAALDASASLLDAFRQRLVDTLLASDTARAGQVIAEAYGLFSIEALVLDIINPTFDAIGEAWAAGEADVATEHLATNYLRQRLMSWLHSGPPPYPVSPVLLACAPGELHEGGLLMLAVLLRRLRWPVAYLGQMTPLNELRSVLEFVNPSVLVFTATSEETAAALADWPAALPEVAASGRPIVGYGGRAFLQQPELVERVPGVFLGQTLHAGVAVLDRILRDLNPLVY